MRSKSVLRISFVSLALATLAACGGSSSPSYGGAPACSASTAIATSQVTIQNMAFSPACIKVAAGTTVTFTNSDIVTHTVTADDGTYNSGSLPPTQPFLHAFATAGTSSYHCTIHAGMTGAVIVQ
jgi:plastocyanin